MGLLDKGPNTGPIDGPGIDAGKGHGIPNRQNSIVDTLVEPRQSRSLEDEDDDFRMPEVDMAYAASLKPSKLHGQRLIYMVTVVAGTGFILFGYDQGVMAGLLDLPAFLEVFPETTGGFDNPTGAVLQSFMVAIYQIGCMLGALLNLYVGDKLGRKKTIYIGAGGIVAGTILQAASVNYGMMIFARIFNGIFNGMLTSTVPTYQSECSKPHRRGQLLLFSGSLITFGVMVSYWIDLAFFYTTGQISWRFPLAFQCIFTFTMVACMWFFRVPESPRWLASKGRHAEAIAVLAALDGLPVDDPKVIKTWHGIVDAVRHSAGDFALKELMTHGKSQHFRRTLLGVLAQCFQQISGINLITYYLTQVLRQMGLDAEMSRIIAGVNGTCYFSTSLIALLIIERLGRRPLMLWTAAAMCGTMIVLAALYEQTARAAQVVSVLCLFLFNTWFSIGWLGMTWLYPAEVTPLRIRAPANALSTASNWLWNFFVVMVTGPMFNNIRWGTYAFFAAMNGIIILPVVYLFFPETKKYSLEDLDLIFAIAHDGGKNPVAVSRSGNIPEAGTREAEIALGRKVDRVPQEKGRRRLSSSGGLARMISGGGKKDEKKYSEHAENRV